MKRLISIFISAFVGVRESCFNNRELSMRDGFEAEANHVHHEAVSGDKWFKVSPYGKFASRVPGRWQYFYQEDAEQMVKEFNSMANRLKRAFRGLSIFAGHPDVDPENYPDDRRHGKIVELEARHDGLWARPVWNDLGRKNLDEEYRIYPSPLWDGKRGHDGFHATRLFSVGLTNSPRIPGSEPVANAKKPGDQESAVNDGTNQNETMDKTKLIEMLGLDADATDEEIFAAVADKIEKADAAAKAPEANAEGDETDKKPEEPKGEDDDEEEMNSRIISLEEERDAAREGQANALIDLAIVEGKITEAERKTQELAFKGDFEAAANSLEAMKPKMNTKEISLEKSRVEVSGEQERREKVANAVAAYRKEHPEADAVAAYAAVKNDPEMKPIFDAMKQPDSAE